MIRFAHLLCASSLILVPGAGFAQQVVGAVGAANAAPTGRAPGQATRALRPGGDIFFKDRIATKRGGSAQLTFLDRSTLSVGENSDLVIDEFVYDPGASGTMRATLSKGVLRFVGGDISHGGGATVNTPAVTIGIRGGIATIGYVKDGADLNAIPGVPANFHGGAIVVNGYGQMTVRNRASEVVLSRPGFAVFVGSSGESIAAPVRLDPKATQALMKALASKGRQHGGASTKVAAAFAGAGIGHLVEVPVALPQLPPIDALDFTSVFSAGSALARNQAQANQASQLHLQIMRAAVASIATTTASAMTTMTTSNTKSATPAATTASTPATTTASTPATTTAGTPATTTAGTPATTTAGTPATTTAGTPATTTAGTPAATTAGTPATTPATTTAGTPATTPATTSATTTASTPATTTAGTPAATTPGTPAATTAVTPATTTAGTPAATTAGTPATTTAVTPATTTAGTPAATTAGTPATITAGTPATTTAGTPATTTAGTPATTTASTPATTTAGTPATTTPSTPATTTAGTPATTTASTPATTTAGTPATTPASTPTTTTASTPATTTAGTPAATTAGTPATTTAGTPATTTTSNASSSSTPTSVQTVYDINVAVVTADVIYAHIIDSGHIQAKQVIYGTSYGSTSGSTVNGSDLTTTGQLNAHDIHAGTVIANVIYVDSVNK